MSRPTRAQKLRLGIFLSVSIALLVGWVGMLVGSAVLEKRDDYYIRFTGSIAGLDRGSQVRYNGVRVGRVEGIRIEPEHVESVRVEITMTAGTTIKADTVATLEMQGITGLKSIELSGGTNAARTLPIGSRIPAVDSDFAVLVERGKSIAAKLDQVVGNLARITGGETGERLLGTVTEVEQTVKTVHGILTENREGTKALVDHANTFMVGLDKLVSEVRGTMKNAQTAVRKVAEWIDPQALASMVRRFDVAAERIAQRFAPVELGKTLKAVKSFGDSATKVLSHADLALLQIKDEFLRALDEFMSGAESFAEFAKMLRDNPAALIRGRTDEERKLP